MVEGSAYLLPPLSSGGASIAGPSLRFHILLIEPDRRNYRILGVPRHIRCGKAACPVL